MTNHFQDASNLTGLLGVANKTTGGFAYFGLLIMFEFIMVLAFMSFGIEVALLSSAFIVLIAGIFLNYLGLISFNLLIFFLAQILFLIMYITWKGRGGSN